MSVEVDDRTARHMKLLVRRNRGDITHVEVRNETEKFLRRLRVSKREGPVGPPVETQEIGVNLPPGGVAPIPVNLVFTSPIHAFVTEAVLADTQEGPDDPPPYPTSIDDFPDPEVAERVEQLFVTVRPDHIKPVTHEVLVEAVLAPHA